MNLEIIMLYEISQKQRDKYCMIPLNMIRNKIHRQKVDESVQGWEEQDGELLLDGHRISVWGDEKLRRQRVVTAAQDYDYTKCQWTTEQLLQWQILWYFFTAINLKKNNNCSIFLCFAIKSIYIYPK